MAADPVLQAEVLLDAGQRSRAEELLLAALRLNPADGRAHLLMARAVASTGDLAGAERHARAATADPHTRAEAHRVLAQLIAFDDTRIREGVDAAARAVELEPDQWRHRAQLAIALADARDLPGAVAQADAAVRLAPDEPTQRARALVSLARVYLSAPHTRDRGHDLMRQAAALDPTDIALQQHIVIAQFATGRRAEAVATAVGVLRQTPTAAVPPVIARFSIYFLVRRLLGWLLLVSFLTPLISLGIVGSAGEPSLLGRAPDLVSRLGALGGLAGFALVAFLVLRPLREPAVARAVWRFARRSALFWTSAVLVGLAVASYLLALVMGAAFIAGIPLPLAVLILARLVHGFGAATLKTPDAAELIARS